MEKGSIMQESLTGGYPSYIQRIINLDLFQGASHQPDDGALWEDARDGVWGKIGPI